MHKFLMAVLFFVLLIGLSWMSLFTFNFIGFLLPLDFSQSIWTFKEWLGLTGWFALNAAMSYELVCWIFDMLPNNKHIDEAFEKLLADAKGKSEK